MKKVLTTALMAPLMVLLLAASPPEVEVTEEEEAVLAEGKMVIRSGVDGIPWKMLGIIDVDAKPAKVWEEILDFDARLAENKPAKDYEMYRDEQVGGIREMSARWDLKVLGQEITYYNNYHYDAAASFLWFDLDEDKESDLVKVDGSYYVIPSPTNEGGSRLIYLVETDTGRKLPESFRVFLGGHGLKDMLKAIKARAE